MATDEELAERLREVLRTSDLNTTTTATLRRRLEEEFGVDLTDKKAFIREQVDLFMKGYEGEDKADDMEVEEVHEEGEESAGVEEVEGRRRSSRTRTKSKRSAKKKASQPKKGGKRGSGFTKICGLSPQLQHFLGVSQMARTEVVKQMWSYIKEKGLQDPADRRNIICDETLHELFRVKSIGMFQMNKALSKHIWTLEDSEPSSSASPAKSGSKEKKKKEEDEDDEKLDEDLPKPKRRKGGSSGILAPLPISDALINFLGISENALPRGNVIKRMWDYIKENNLQDPSDKRIILCDDKLKELLKVDTFRGFSIAKLLVPHFIKAEQ